MFKKTYNHNKVSVRVKDGCEPDFSHIHEVVKVERAYPKAQELAGIYILLVREGCVDWVQDQVRKMDDVEFTTKLRF